VVSAAFVPSYSGGTARDLHPLPFAWKIYVGRTLKDSGQLVNTAVLIYGLVEGWTLDVNHSCLTHLVMDRISLRDFATP
jgi:hypothetical protein